MENLDFIGFFYLPYSLVEEIKKLFPEKFSALDSSELINIEQIFDELIDNSNIHFSAEEIIEAHCEGSDYEERVANLCRQALRILAIRKILIKFVEITKPRITPNKFYSISPPHPFKDQEINLVRCIGRTNFLSVYRVRGFVHGSDEEIIFELGVGNREIREYQKTTKPTLKLV